MNAPLIGLTAQLGRLKGLSIAKLGPALGRALYATASKIAVDAQVSITRGAVSGKGHVPSRPGEPPMNDTGMLANAIEAALVEPLKAEVRSNAPYSEALEYGTSTIAERPFWRPAIAKNKDTLRDNVTAVLNRAIAGG
jgi:hypothetical protein